MLNRRTMPDTPLPAEAPFKVAALYKFVALNDIAVLQPALAEFCCAHGIRGTLLLAPEGINGTVAGTPEAIDAFVDHILADNRFAGAEIKFSFAEEMPFYRMKVRLKSEIVTLRAPEADPNRQVGTYVPAEAWNTLIEQDDVVLVDTRNAYEVGLGTFEGAIDPKTQNFTEFKQFVAEKLDPARDRKVAMFCTGGIRCEKASSYLLAQGFKEVFHLKGGILSYLEKVPEASSKWQGECFVFDERVSVGHGLALGAAKLCRACRHPLTPDEQAHADFIEGVQCPHCAGQAARKTRAAERQRQIELAEARGVAHLGDDARELGKALAEEKRMHRRDKGA